MRMWSCVCVRCANVVVCVCDANVVLRCVSAMQMWSCVCLVLLREWSCMCLLCYVCVCFTNVVCVSLLRDVVIDVNPL
jgi:hypothetical protein